MIKNSTTRYNVLRKFLLLINIIKTYKTWHLAVLDRYNLLNGMIKHILRNNAQYLVRARADDTGKINAIYIGKQYSEHLHNIIDGAIVIDIGAHIGIFSIFAKMLAKDVTVYSYEPSDESFALLKENIRLNKAEDNIRAFNLGVSGKRGPRRLYLSKTNPGENSIFGKAGEFIQIDTISLKDVFDENNIKRCDFLKIDCEGAEYEILFNTPREYLDRIKNISMEYHDDNLIRPLIDLLKDSGFEVTFKKEKAYLLYAKKI